MSKKQLPKIKSLGELRRLTTTDGPLKERYCNLAIIAARNLGAMIRESSSPVHQALQHLNSEADAIDDENGIVAEVNFCRDIEANGQVDG